MPFGGIPMRNLPLFKLFFGTLPGSPQGVLTSLIWSSVRVNTLDGYELPRTRPLDTSWLKR